MKVYGLTGGIAAGKSEASRRFEELGIPVIDSDRIGHATLEPGGGAAEQVVKHFGAGIVTDGRIDREKLGRIVFKDAAALKRLNEMVHPAVMEEVASRTEVLEREGHAVVIIEAALHAEDGKLRECMAGLILVDCPREERMRRLIEGRGVTEEEALGRIESQTPPEEKRRLARWVIMNDQDIAHLLEQVDSIAREL